MSKISGSAVSRLEEVRCPDGGFCHHACQDACYRVKVCGPLSGVYPDNRWPEEVR